jgi:DNA replication licensing factor MCM4
MGVLRDYIAYAREHVQPKLSDEAQQRLIQAYVDMRKIGSNRGQISGAQEYKVSKKYNV